MTLERAIERYTAGMNIYAGCKENKELAEEYTELVRFLTELQERRAEDKADLASYNRRRPLTPYELMGMDGQEVYVVWLWEGMRNKYATVDTVGMNVVYSDEDGYMWLLSFAPRTNEKSRAYYYDWLAFRKKPEDETEVSR